MIARRGAVILPFPSGLPAAPPGAPAEDAAALAVALLGAHATRLVQDHTRLRAAAGAAGGNRGVLDRRVAEVEASRREVQRAVAWLQALPAAVRR